MKKHLKLLGVFLIAATLLSSCGNSEKEQLIEYEKSAMERMEKYRQDGHEVIWWKQSIKGSWEKEK